MAWQVEAIAEIEARGDLHPNSRAAIHHGFRVARRALISLRYAIENALNRKGLTSATPVQDFKTNILVRHSALAELPALIDDYRLSLEQHPDPGERVFGRGATFVLAAVNKQIQLQLDQLDKVTPVPF